MPLNKKGKKIMSAMKKQYGDEAEAVFYASKNKGTMSKYFLSIDQGTTSSRVVLYDNDFNF